MDFAGWFTLGVVAGGLRARGFLVTLTRRFPGRPRTLTWLAGGSREGAGFLGLGMGGAALHPGADRHGGGPGGALMVGSGCSFLTPLGCRTHIMVYGPGGYRFLDFARLGGPLALLAALIVAFLAPVVYG